jgi:hypothetical protein
MKPIEEREARLLATLINVLVAGASDPTRLSKGRTYARQGAVVYVDVVPGLLTGEVQGNRSQAYTVEVSTDLVRHVNSVADLVPAREEVMFQCSCPDWEDPCKHTVAVMSAFSEQVSHDPGVLLHWRGADTPPSAERAVIGSRRAGASAPARAASTRGSSGRELDDDERALLETFFGNASDSIEPPQLTVLPPPKGAWDEPWSAMLDDALEVLGTIEPNRRRP